MSTPATPRPTLADCPCLRPARDDLPPTWAARNEVPAPPPGRVWLYGPGSRPIASALLDCPCKGTGKIEPGPAPAPPPDRRPDGPASPPATGSDPCGPSCGHEYLYRCAQESIRLLGSSGCNDLDPDAERFLPDGDDGPSLLGALIDDWQRLRDEAAARPPLRRGPAAAAQPAPVPSRHRPTWQVVIARAKARRDQHEDGASWSLWYRLACDMIDRDQVGRERYGVPLGPWNGRDSLTDLYQEVLDGCCYAANHAIEHPDDTRARMMADEMMQLSLRVRAMIDEREGR